VASILDLAVIALAVMVCISMALLAWTLGVSVTAALRRLRRDVILVRLELAVAARRLRGGGPPIDEPEQVDEGVE
jgi:hypothetical protein